MLSSIPSTISKINKTVRAVKNPAVFALDFFGLIKDKEVIYECRNGVKMITRVGTTDKAEVAIIFSDSEYPKRYFPSCVNPVILDIGAHIGSFSLYIAKELKLGKPRIFAIEPSKENYKTLRRNLNLNGIKNIKTFKIALSEKNGWGYLDTSSTHDAFKLSKVIPKKAVSHERIQLNTLETFCKKNKIEDIDLMKMDIEGSEHDVFTSSINFIKKRVKSALLEVHDIDSQRNMITFEKLLIKNGFSIEDKIENRTLFIRRIK